jgi:hypothetical protein
MSREVVERLSASLQAHAAVEVDTGHLLAQATVRGQRLVRRRYAGFAAFACAVTTVAMLVPSVVSRGAPLMPGSSTDRPETIAVLPPRLSVVAEGHLPVLPKAPADQSAKVRPDLVGKDPAVLHFGVANLATSARSVTWATGSDLEIMQIERAIDKYSWVTLSSNGDVLDMEIRQRTGAYADAGTQETVDVDGRKGTLRTIPTSDGVSYLVRWEPLAGLIASVHVRAGVLQELWDLVDRVQLNEASRCVVPFGLRHLPSDMRLIGCRVSIRGYEDETGSGVKWLRLVDAELSVGTASDRARVGLYADPKTLVEGPPRAMATGGDGGLSTSAYPGEIVDLGGGGDGKRLQLYIEGGYKHLIGKVVSDSLVMCSDLNNPETWPEPVA